MKNVYICNIAQKDGLFNFEISDVSVLKDHYNVMIHSEDNLNSIYDVAMNIIDEEPDFALMYLYNHNAHVIFSIIQILLEEKFTDIILVNKNTRGITKFHNQDLRIIADLNDLLPGEESNSSASIPAEEFFTLDTTMVDCGEIYTSMKNGLDMYLTGSYVTSNFITNVKHLEVEKDAKIPFEELSPELLNMNSAFIYHVDKPTDGFYYKLKKNADQLVFSHIHQYADDHVKIDNLSEPLRVKRMKYSQYEKQNGEIVFLDIVDKDDMEALLEDVQSFGRSGILNKPNAKIINSCIFNSSACSLLKLTRGHVNREGDFMPCINCSKPIGNVKDEYFELLKSASKTMNKERVNRNCTDCRANVYCSKCAMLPDQLDREYFCNVMRANPLIHDYNYKALLFADIIKYSKLFTTVDLSKLQVNNMDYTLAFDMQAQYPMSKLNNLFTAFRIDDDIYILGFKLPKIYQTDERFVYIAEGYIRDVPINELTTYYGERYSIPQGEAENHVLEALRIIKESRVI
ncbi:MAG: hypothetical protein PHX16_01390 [Syntrophaceticus sp.]|nr:hypothetical protein [Syntrophaceticus sp.]MDD3314001.1 hypothetical protein [Syntrophaceticus sp.]MDD4359310.1 hypothetical protein [Syntrophaceticus sp.]MDD4782286.1 hypothetical protein [Syntrophaceticus sp.]